MRSSLLMLASVLAAASIAHADEAITLTDDVLFVWNMRHDPHGHYGTCGFGILGNHGSHADPKVVYDINLDQIFNGEERVAGFNVGTFDVSGGKRTPRSPVTAFSFSYEGGGEPIPVTFVGPPNASNTMTGKLDLERSAPLFEAFAFGNKWITMTLTYADGHVETLRTQGARGGAYGGPKMNPYARCLRGDTPPIGRLRRAG